jgi:hypothetical protein
MSKSVKINKVLNNFTNSQCFFRALTGFDAKKLNLLCIYSGSV